MTGMVFWIPAFAGMTMECVALHVHNLKESCYSNPYDHPFDNFWRVL